MDSENPLEIAQRVWPGDWVQDDGCLKRKLPVIPPFQMTLTLTKRSPPSVKWDVRLYDGDHRWIVTPLDLERALHIARDHVQALACAFATSVGLEVRDGRAE